MPLVLRSGGVIMAFAVGVGVTLLAVTIPPGGRRASAGRGDALLSDSTR